MHGQSFFLQEPHIVVQEAQMWSEWDHSRTQDAAERFLFLEISVCFWFGV